MRARLSEPTKPTHQARRPLAVAAIASLVFAASFGCSTEVDYGASSGGSPPAPSETPTVEIESGPADPAPPETSPDEIFEAISPPAPASQVEPDSEATPPIDGDRFLLEAPSRTSEPTPPRYPEDATQEVPPSGNAPDTASSVAPPDALKGDQLAADLFRDLDGFNDGKSSDDKSSEAGDQEASDEDDEPTEGINVDELFPLPVPTTNDARDEASEDDDEPASDPLELPLPTPALPTDNAPGTPAEPPLPGESPETEPQGEAPVGLKPIRPDPDNTRHLAWLLGAKAAVVSLASLAGVDEAKDRQWETKALADMLGVSQPNDLAALADSESIGVAVARLIRQARATADELERRHGADHAALMEIALKTNALLVLYESRPALADLVLRAVRDANTRARLPAEVLTPLTGALDRREPAEQVRRAVHELHRVVERLLREGRLRQDA